MSDKTVSEKLKIIHIEDSPEDAELIEDCLKREFENLSIYLVSKSDEFLESLDNIKPDIILSDFHLPGFGGLEALDILKERARNIPFIFITGAVGEEMAIESLKSGATDFILKSNLQRLGPAIKRALVERRISDERKKLYDTLIKNEEKFRTLLENLPVGVFRTTYQKPGIIIQANNALARMSGKYTSSDVIGRETAGFFYEPDDYNSIIKEITGLKKINHRICKFKDESGNPFWGSVSASVHYDGNGLPIWIDGIIEDITEKVNIEEKLSGYLRFFETLIDTINTPVFYNDIEGRYLGCNRVFSRLIMGLPREEIIGKTVFELGETIPLSLAEKYDSMDRELLGNPGVQEYESGVRCADGSLRYFHFSKATYSGTDGKTAGLVGIMMDITERVENERELKRINEELDLLINSMSGLLIGVSVKDRITHWNPFAESILGLKADEIVGKQFFESGIRWNWEIVYEAVGRSVLNEKSIRIDEIEFDRADGSRGFLGLTINPLKRGGEILEGFMILGRDITEQKIVQSQLMQSSKLEAIGQLAAGVAHEINSPLQYVGDNLKFLKKTFNSILRLLGAFQEAVTSIDNPEKCHKAAIRASEISDEINLLYLIKEMPDALEQSLEGVQRVSKIVQSMKAFSHPGTGSKTMVNLNRAIENTVTVTRNEWKYDSEVELKLDSSLHNVPCFESEFNQVILNLIINAADAIKEAKEKKIIESGLIKISTAQEKDYAVIRIEDNGGGIPDNIKNRIFDPFFTTKEVGKGTGQGLPISHSIIVEKHNGMIYFESSEGKGTTFIIKLPIEEEI